MKPQIQISIKPVPLDVCLDQNFRREAYALESMHRAAPALYAALQDYLRARPAFRSSPMGAAGSLARMEQDNAIEAEDRAYAALAQADGVSCL